MPKSWYTIGLLLAFLGTTAALQWWQLQSYSWEVWVCLGILALFCVIDVFSAYVWKRYKPGFGLLLLSMTIGASLAFFRVAQTTHTSGPSDVETYADHGEVVLHGYIAVDPDRRPLMTRYTVAVDGVWEENASGRVLVTDYNLHPRHGYGDEVLVTGKLERPTQIESFHYDRYLSRYGIYSVVYEGEVETLSKGHGHPFFEKMYALKREFETQINRLYPEPHASFLAGLLTGSRRGIPEHLLEDFRATGLTHIIAISGYNITIVLSFIGGLLFFLPIRARFFPSVIAIVLFAYFVGASPPVVRAAIMGVLGLFAVQSGRQRHSFLSILVAAALMTAWNPKMLWYDAGFQLSFLAVFGLALFAPLFERCFHRLPKYLGEPLQMAIAAQLMAIPLIVLLFGNLSLVAPLANVLVAIPVPFAMLFGFVGTVVSSFSFPLGQCIAYVGWGFLEFIIIVSETLSRVPHALLPLHNVQLWSIAVYYVVLLGVVHLLSHRLRFYHR